MSQEIARKLMDKIHAEKKDWPKLDHLQTICDPSIQLPAWAVGPFRRNEGLTFRKTAQWADESYRSHAIFNPALMEKDGKLYMYYRATPVMESLESKVGLAVFNGEKWQDYAGNPVVDMETEAENLGVEDPKIYKANGQYYLFYNACCVYDPQGEAQTEFGDVAVDISVATSQDLLHFTKKGPVVPAAVSRRCAKGAVVPRNGRGEAVKINGEYLMLFNTGEDGRKIQLVGHSADFESWTFEERDFLDANYLHQLEEVACCVTEDDWDYFILDVYHVMPDGEQRGTQVRYLKADPYTPLEYVTGATFSWGGLIKYRGSWTFAQGWEAQKGEETMYLYTEMPK